MLFGPIFEFDIKTSARTARHHLIKATFGLILLYFLWVSYSVMLETAPEGKLSISQVNQMNFAIFAATAVIEYAIVLLLTPALVSGVIAEEKRRKTLHYLLTSRLSGTEIVLGKIAVRLLHLLAYLLVAAPVVSLLVLMGGVDPGLVLMSYLYCISAAVFLGGLSVLMSVFARKTRDALFATYSLMMLWLFGIPFYIYYGSFFFPNSPAWLSAVNEAIYATNPLSSLNQTSVFGPATGSSFRPRR